MYEVGLAVLIGLGVVDERRQCKVTLAYRRPILRSDGAPVHIVMWRIRRLKTADGFEVWSATATDPLSDHERVKLEHLDGKSEVLCSELRLLLSMMGLRGVALNTLKLCGVSCITNLATTAGELANLSAVRGGPLYCEDARGQAQ